MAVCCNARLLYLALGIVAALDSLDNLKAELPDQLASLLTATDANFERSWKYVARKTPLAPIGLDDVEAWMDLGSEVRADDVELFRTPPEAQAGRGGDFQSSPREVPIQGRLKRIRKAFRR